MENIVNIIGLGYIGLPTALMFAAHGVKVVGTDYKTELVQKLQSGQLTFEEDGLAELFRQAVDSGNIRFTGEYDCVDIYIVAVPTPYDKVSKRVDATYVVNAVADVLKVCPRGAIIIVESTIPPGTIDKYIRPMASNGGFIPGTDIHFVHAPERIIPGFLVSELRRNARTIGADSSDIGERVRQLYSSFCESEIVLTDIRTAEMTKVVENTFRDISIAYANELTQICRMGDLDVHEIIRIANKHPRVNILNPGPGVGGHCIPVDPWFLVGEYPTASHLIHAARQINDFMPEYVLERISVIMDEQGLKDYSRVGLYGLAYKENVDDVRESPTLQLLESMHKHLAKGLKVYDPYVTTTIVDNQYHDFDAFLNDVDMVVVMLAHDEMEEKKEQLLSKIVLDTRNTLDLPGTYRL